MPDFLKTRPRELSSPLLTNPGKGCATFQRFDGDPLNAGERWSEEGPLAFPARRFPGAAPGYLPSTVAYCRWFWDAIERSDGRLNFRMVEGALRTARVRGQTVQVRLMPFGAHGQPQLPGWYRRRYGVRSGKAKGRRYVYLEPYYENDEYLERWGRVIVEFGRRFDGHPELESVDLAYIGPWGEGAGDMSPGTIERFTALYADAHPRTPLLVNSDGEQFAAGIRHGTGWRCDCFGDLRSSGDRYEPEATGWNHTYESYPMAVAHARAAEAWRTRPVAFETCSVPLTWRRRDYDLDLIMRQGYKFHCSVFMPKSNEIPAEWLRPLAEFCDRIGYRFVLRHARWERSARRGGRLAIQLWIENTGVAPAYRDWRLAFRFRQGARAVVVETGHDARSWLPGDAWLEPTLPVPATLGRGAAVLEAGLVRPGTSYPRLRFATEGADRDGWLPLGPLRLS